MTTSAKFEGNPTLEIDTNGSLLVKFKASGVENKVNYELKGNAVVVYTSSNVKAGPEKQIVFNIHSTLPTSSSIDKTVNATIVSKLPPPKLGLPKIVAFVKYENLVLEDSTYKIEKNVGSIEKKFHNYSGVKSLGAISPPPSINVQKAVVSAVAPPPVTSTIPLGPTVEHFTPAAKHKFAGASQAPQKVLEAAKKVAPNIIITPLAPEKPRPSIVIAASSTTPVQDPSIDNDGILTIDIDDSEGIKKIILNLK